MILGIAADDIFVFCDAWRQSELITMIAGDEKRRLAYAWKRSFRAIAVTSSTTAVAFLANAASDIRPIRAFGIFAAIIVPVNFFIVILMMPSVMIYHDKHFKEKCAYRKCCCRPKKAETHIHKQVADTERDTEQDAEAPKLGKVKVEGEKAPIDAAK